MNKVLWGLCFFCMPALADVKVSGRHVYMLGGGLDEVVGTYVFLVSNLSDEPEKARIPLMLPKETVDFRPFEGTAPEELELSEDGRVVLAKEFKPGDQIVTIGFKASGGFGKGDLTFQAPQDISHLTLFVNQDDLKVASLDESELDFKENEPFGGRVYNTYTRSLLKKGESLRIRVDGLVEGRERFYWLGGALLLLLIVAAGALSYRTRPLGAEKVS